VQAKGIAIRVASPKLVMEEAPEVCVCVALWKGPTGVYLFLVAHLLPVHWGGLYCCVAEHTFKHHQRLQAIAALK